MHFRRNFEKILADLCVGVVVDDLFRTSSWESGNFFFSEDETAEEVCGDRLMLADWVVDDACLWFTADAVLRSFDFMDATTTSFLAAERFAIAKAVEESWSNAAETELIALLLLLLLLPAADRTPEQLGALHLHFGTARPEFEYML